MEKHGKQPLSPNSAMEKHIGPAALRAKITKRIGWHTFRRTYTTLLHANGEDVKTVQELLRHGRPTATKRDYVQAIPEDLRRAQAKLIYGVLAVSKTDPEVGRRT